VDSVNDADGTVCEAIKRLKPTYFANGGDRGRANTPEQKVCEEMGVELLWGIGGTEKLQSSSRLTKSKRDFELPPNRVDTPHSER
jgi:D-beta-D-heptose 7-phosphate kinase/D-beta-D-heptose 1-phosphate adenosyltransferase